MRREIDPINDNLATTKWVGVVVNNEDPLKIGRCQVRVYGKFDMREDPFSPDSPYIIPDESLPWCYPATSSTSSSATGGAGLSVPKKDSIVSITFDNGNPYYPEYNFNQHYSDEVLAEIENSYLNAHILWYDVVTEGGMKVFFTEEKGLMFDYKESQINIKPDNSIVILNPNGDTVTLSNDGNLTISTSAKVKVDSPSIELGSQATEALIKGNTFQAIFNAHTHIGNLGAPTGPPIVPLNGSELSTVTKTQ
jgi:hypothetical protein